MSQDNDSASTSEHSIDTDEAESGADGATTASKGTEAAAAAVTSEYKVIGQKASSSGAGVMGHNTATSGSAYGVVGETDSPDGTGVRGHAASSSGQPYGVMGTTSSASGYAVYADGDSRTTGNHEVDGHVQASQGLRANVGASVYLANNWTIGASAVDTLVFDTVTVDERGEYDPSTGEFTFAYDGTYAVECMVKFSVDAGDSLQMNLKVNGGSVANNQFTANGTESKLVSKTLFNVAKGSVLDVVITNRESSQKTIFGATEAWTYLTVHQVG